MTPESDPTTADAKYSGAVLESDSGAARGEFYMAGFTAGGDAATSPVGGVIAGYTAISVVAAAAAETNPRIQVASATGAEGYSGRNAPVECEKTAVVAGKAAAGGDDGRNPPRGGYGKLNKRGAESSSVSVKAVRMVQSYFCLLGFQ